MFDVDGTLVQSYKLDSDCFRSAVFEVLGNHLYEKWEKYTHVSDAGILDQHLVQNGLQHKRNEIHQEVKSIFCAKVAEGLNKKPVQPIPGATSFLSHLKKLKNVSISIATGGWYESAKLKLESAGIDITDIPIATSNDHFSRHRIMEISKLKAVNDKHIPCTYFGDAQWDKDACKQLGYDFILVGRKIEHKIQIPDFMILEHVCSLLNL